MNTKNNFAFAAIVILLTITGSAFASGTLEAGNGSIVTVNPDVEAFSAVEINGIDSFTIVESDEYDVTVQTDDNLADAISVWNEGSRLIVSFSERWEANPTEVSATISLPRLSSLSVRGDSCGTVEVPTTESFDLLATGSSNVSMASLTADTAKIRLLNQAELSATVNVDELVLRVSNSTLTLEGYARYIDSYASENALITFSELYVEEPYLAFDNESDGNLVLRNNKELTILSGQILVNDESDVTLSSDLLLAAIVRDDSDLVSTNALYSVNGENLFAKGGYISMETPDGSTIRAQ